MPHLTIISWLTKPNYRLSRVALPDKYDIAFKFPIHADILIESNVCSASGISCMRSIRRSNSLNTGRDFSSVKPTQSCPNAANVLVDLWTS
jgi:hypothetical protein